MAATLAALEERIVDSEVEVIADLDSFAATEVALALLRWKDSTIINFDLTAILAKTKTERCFLVWSFGQDFC